MHYVINATHNTKPNVNLFCIFALRDKIVLSDRKTTFICRVSALKEAAKYRGTNQKAFVNTKQTSKDKANQLDAINYKVMQGTGS